MPPLLTLHQLPQEERWALDGQALSPDFDLARWLGHPEADRARLLREGARQRPCEGALLPPLDVHHEVWTAVAVPGASPETPPLLAFEGMGYRVMPDRGSLRMHHEGLPTRVTPCLALLVDGALQVAGHALGISLQGVPEHDARLGEERAYPRSCAIGPGFRLTSELPSLEEIRLSLGSGEGAACPPELPMPSALDRLRARLEWPQGGVLLVSLAGGQPLTGEEGELHLSAGEMELRVTLKRP